MSHMFVNPVWQIASTDSFWKDIARFDHVIQVYENEGVFLDALIGFVIGAIDSDETAIVVATDSHLNELESRMEGYNLNVEALIATKKFIPLNAEELLSEFMVNNQLDRTLFDAMVSSLFAGLGNNGKKVRAFGEMVAILWERGNKEVAIELENIWDELSRQNGFSLFCAYPKKAFDQKEKNSEATVCCLHTKMICGSQKQLTHVRYRQIA